MPKQKFYVVWQGNVPGIYTDWETCRAQVLHFPAARYKAFATRAEAEAAFAAGAPAAKAGREAAAAASGAHAANLEANAVALEANAFSTPTKAKKCARPRQRGTSPALPPNPPSWRHDTVLPLPQGVEAQAIAVDAACSGNPGPMEYRGVCLTTGATLFHYGPVYGTNNIGEFLAIVHALALLKQQGITRTVYSDSRNAMLWVKARKCRTRLARTPRTEPLFQLIARAENWLATHQWNDIPLLKWNTRAWGEVPADFGRK